MNTEKLTMLARPYAVAAFEYGSEKNDLAGWESFLKNAAMIAQDKTMAVLLRSPELSQAELFHVFCDILGKTLDENQKNFLHLLSEYQRLPALPEIAELFSALRAEQEKTLKVYVSSAIALNDEQKKKMIQALNQRFKRHVSLQCKVDASLLGGVIIQAGDTVIDGSVRGKLSRLNDFILNAKVNQ